MTMTLAPDLHVLDDGLLDRLAVGDVAQNLALLGQTGYLLLAVPVEFGGLGGNLVQAAEQHRRLARRAAETALAVTMHLAWTGVASDFLAAGDASLRWILEGAAAGDVYTVRPDGTDDAVLLSLAAWAQCLSASAFLGVADHDLRLVPAFVEYASAVSGTLA